MSQRDAQSEEIDGVMYTVFMLPPRKASRLALRIGKAIGPALGNLADSSGSMEAAMEADVGSGAFAKASTAFFEGLDEATLDAVMEALMEVSEADGVRLKGIFDIHFMGKLGAMVKWLWFALKVNYESFFGVLGDGLSRGLTSQPGSVSQGTLRKTG